jgi:hypothetical protein
MQDLMGDEFSSGEIAKMAWEEALKKVNAAAAPVSQAVNFGMAAGHSHYPPPPQPARPVFNL